jgi:hypothetical protein
MLGRLVEAVRAGQSGALVLCGEPGVAKTALLQHLTARAAECRVAQIAGTQSEMELAIAGLHQLWASLLVGLNDLPERRGDARRIQLCWCDEVQPGPGDTKRLFIGGRGAFGAITTAILKITVNAVWEQTTPSRQTLKESA